MPVPSSLVVLRARAEALAVLVHCGEVKLEEAVATLDYYATTAGLFDTSGGVATVCAQINAAFGECVCEVVA